MSEAGSTLPQTEIDAIFKQAKGRNMAPSSDSSSSQNRAVQEKMPASAPVPGQKAGSQHPGGKPAQTVAASPENTTLKKIMETLNALTERIENLEAGIIALEQKELDSVDMTALSDVLIRRIENDKQQLRDVSLSIEKIVAGLKNTPGFGIRKNYTCGNCGSHGYMVIPVKCSSCGTGGWWGWWPE